MRPIQRATRPPPYLNLFKFYASALLMQISANLVRKLSGFFGFERLLVTDAALTYWAFFSLSSGIVLESGSSLAGHSIVTLKFLGLFLLVILFF